MWAKDGQHLKKIFVFGDWGVPLRTRPVEDHFK